MLGPLGFFLALLLGLGCLYFGIMNQTPVAVTLLPGIAPRSAFIGEIALYSAMVGALVAGLLWFPAWLGVRRHVRRLGRRVRELERQVKSSTPMVEETPVTPLATGVSEPELVAPRRVTAHVDEEPV